MTTHAYLLPLATLLAIGCSPERRYERILSHVDSDSAQLSVIDASGSTWSGASGDDVTTEQAFLIGSNTKVLTAAVVLQLVEEGALSLEESASIWVPQLDPAITIRDLLQHTSGIGEYFDHDEMTAHDGAAMADEWRPEELIALGLEVRDDGPQATATYANTNYIALGLVVEAVEERSIGATLSERLFAPLGMTRSGLLLSGDAVPAHLVLGEGGAWGEVTWVDPSVGWAAGSAYASASDLARFYDAMLTGELYGPELVAAQRDAVAADLGFHEPGVETSYGLGLMVVDVGGQVVVGHLGKVKGFTSMVMRDEATGAQTTLLTNASEVDFVTPSFDALEVAGRR